MSDESPSQPASSVTVSDAQKVLLPEAASRFQAWKSHQQEQGVVIPPDTKIDFVQDLASGITYESHGNTIDHVSLPFADKKWTVADVESILPSKSVFDAQYKHYNDSAAELNAISAIAAGSGQKMPEVYTASSNEIHTPAAAIITKEGIGVMLIDPHAVSGPGAVKGASGHELGHIAAAHGDPKQYAALNAIAHNDTTGIVKRGLESQADAFAVQNGAGAELRDLLISMDKKHELNPNDKDHPSITDRVAAINQALCDLKLPQCTLVDVDHSTKSPLQVGSGAPAQSGSLNR